MGADKMLRNCRNAGCRLDVEKSNVVFQETIMCHDRNMHRYTHLHERGDLYT